MSTNASERWTAVRMPDMTDRTVVVTGANSGLGFEATKELARAGAHVVMACRNPERAEDARERAERAVRDASLDVRELDLADLSSVRAFAEGFAAEYDALHVLMNNAGVMAPPRRETADGFELQFGVNHLGHFALTGLLLDRLRMADGETRVVTTSSGAHKMGGIDFEDLQSERSYSRWRAYGQSKLANLLFTYELQRRLDRAVREDPALAGEMKAVAAHPGWAATELQTSGPTMGEGESSLRGRAMEVANRLVAQSARMGTLPLLYAATAENVDGSDYIGPGGPFEMRGYPVHVASNERSHDHATARRLWAVSEELTGVTYDLPSA
ncbi:oxidoreductase [Halomarina litorea]|uniref:oxidoreductase n=1 Tax=Halomarina litorea TaxID=2961595 RepID=UPI0020C21F86|nr:oxidoreductase [Halomarina sp. BCD28]